MQHLTPERLAALADETPTADEGAHLAHCLACRRERDVYVALLELAQREGRAGVAPGALAPVGEPSTTWDGLSSVLRAEGLIDETLTTGDWRPTPRSWGGAAAGARVSARRGGGTWWRQLAAASVLLAAGLSAGRATAGVAVPRWQGGAGRGATAAVGGDADGGGPRGGAGGASDQAAFADVAEAAEALAQAQRDYQRAAGYLAVHDTSAFVGGSDALRARLAALDGLIPRVREALSDAPQDPVLNQYYQTTTDARETTLRQLRRALPVGMRLTGY